MLVDTEAYKLLVHKGQREVICELYFEHPPPPSPSHCKARVDVSCTELCGFQHLSELIFKTIFLFGLGCAI